MTKEFWPPDETFQFLQGFVLDKWKERAAETGRPEPSDLTSACKFASLFTYAALGAPPAGNHGHQFNVMDGKIFDLCAGSADIAAMPDAYRHEPSFWGNAEHVESVNSCLPRVEKWVAEFHAIAGASSPPAKIDMQAFWREETTLLSSKKQDSSKTPAPGRDFNR